MFTKRKILQQIAVAYLLFYIKRDPTKMMVSFDMRLFDCILKVIYLN